MKKCTRHGSKYQIDTTSVLCSHPECIKRIVLAIGTKSNSVKSLIQIIQEHHSFDDMVGYLVERLLIEKNEGKPMVINPTFLWFTLNRFVRDEMIQIAIEDELQQITEEVPESLCGWYVRKNGITPEHILIGRDLLSFISDKWGESYALYLSGNISKADLLKVSGLGYNKLRDKLNDIRTFFDENFLLHYK